MSFLPVKSYFLTQLSLLLLTLSHLTYLFQSSPHHLRMSSKKKKALRSLNSPQTILFLQMFLQRILILSKVKIEQLRSPPKSQVMFRWTSFRKRFSYSPRLSGGYSTPVNSTKPTIIAFSDPLSSNVPSQPSIESVLAQSPDIVSISNVSSSSDHTPSIVLSADSDTFEVPRFIQLTKLKGFSPQNHGGPLLPWFTQNSQNHCPMPRWTLLLLHYGTPKISRPLSPTNLNSLSLSTVLQKEKQRENSRFYRFSRI